MTRVGCQPDRHGCYLRLQSSTNNCLRMTQIGKHIRDQVRQSGFGLNTEDLIIDRLSPLPMVESSHQLACNLLDFVSKESSQLQFGESAPGTTEVIESLFGYFKHVKNGLWDAHGGIGRLILTMASRVGELTSGLVTGALNNIQQSDLVQWFDGCRCAEVL